MSTDKNKNQKSPKLEMPELKPLDLNQRRGSSASQSTGRSREEFERQTSSSANTHRDKSDFEPQKKKNTSKNRNGSSKKGNTSKNTKNNSKKGAVAVAGASKASAANRNSATNRNSTANASTNRNSTTDPASSSRRTSSQKKGDSSKAAVMKHLAFLEAGKNAGKRYSNRKGNQEGRKPLSRSSGNLVFLLACILVSVFLLIFIDKAFHMVMPKKNATETSVQTPEDHNNELSPSGSSQDKNQTPAGTTTEGAPEATTEKGSDLSMDELLSKAAFLAAGYDYSGAIELLKADSNYAQKKEVLDAIESYQAQKDACVPVDVENVPHIFYHSLIVNPKRAFKKSNGQYYIDDMNAWFITIDEFDKITQSLYDRGYVYVRLRDLVVESKDKDGKRVYKKNTKLMLPPDKKAIVLSIDDLSYYHCYEKGGFPDKLVLDDNGKVKCQYTTAKGEVRVGDYDVMPRLNTFLEEHPDGAYKGARGLIAMTGYNGVFGYRTDIDYEVKKHLMSDQADWLKKNPDFDRDKEIEQAKVIAQAIKDSGWEFASHTWGHLSVTTRSAEQLKTDNKKWEKNVRNIVGKTDTIIFAHGNDIQDEGKYTFDNAKFSMYYKAGYRYFCNVDAAHPAWIQFGNRYVRQARINIDGFMLYRTMKGKSHVVDQLFNAKKVFDPARPTPVRVTNQKD